jgi:hypothetical protein
MTMKTLALAALATTLVTPALAQEVPACDAPYVIGTLIPQALADNGIKVRRVDNPRELVNDGSMPMGIALVLFAREDATAGRESKPHRRCIANLITSAGRVPARYQITLVGDEIEVDVRENEAR